LIVMSSPTGAAASFRRPRRVAAEVPTAPSTGVAAMALAWMYDDRDNLGEAEGGGDDDCLMVGE